MTTSTFSTHGASVRNYFELLHSLVDEAIVQFRDDEWWCACVDPANVAMFEVSLPASEFDTYEAEHEKTGVNIDAFTSELAFARKGRGDDRGDSVRFAFQAGDNPDDAKTPGLCTATMSRDDLGVSRVHRRYMIDPASIHQKPDVPSLGLPMRARIDPSALRTITKNISANHVRFEADPSSDDDAESLTEDGDRCTLLLTTEPDDGDGSGGDEYRIKDAAWAASGEASDSDLDASSMLSMNYLQPVAKALNKFATRITVEWGEDYPVLMRFESEDVGIEGKYLQAPRIEN